MKIRSIVSITSIPFIWLILSFAAEDRGPSKPRSDHHTSLVRRSETPQIRSRGRTWAGARCQSCARDANGRIARSSAARRAFRVENPCPATNETTGACPGYVIDHMIALKRGGLDEPRNMQWQTKAEARAKDRIE